MSYLPAKMPSGADTFSTFAVYRKSVSLTTVGQTVLLTTDDNLGQFVATEIRFNVDNNAGSELTTFTASIGWNASSYDNLSASAAKGTTSTSSSLQYLRLKANKVDRFTLRTSAGYYAAFATPANASTEIRLNLTASGMGAGSSATFFVVGYYAGSRP